MEIRRDREECGKMIDSTALVQGLRRLAAAGRLVPGVDERLPESGPGNCRRTILKARWRGLFRNGGRVAVVN